MGTLLGGVYWTVNRRMRLALENAHEGDTPPATEIEPDPAAPGEGQDDA